MVGQKVDGWTKSLKYVPGFSYEKLEKHLVIDDQKTPDGKSAEAFKEAPYSWFSLKHFLYRSESSRDSRVESSRSGEIFKNYI